MHGRSERTVVLDSIASSISYAKEGGTVFSHADEVRRLVASYPDAGFTVEALLVEFSRLWAEAGLPPT